jgi:hypothetical protein
MTEAIPMVAAIVQRFRLALVPGQRATPTPHITRPPVPGIRVRLEPRWVRFGLRAAPRAEVAHAGARRLA